MDKEHACIALCDPPWLAAAHPGNRGACGQRSLLASGFFHVKGRDVGQRAACWSCRGKKKKRTKHEDGFVLLTESDTDFLPLLWFNLKEGREGVKIT